MFRYINVAACTVDGSYWATQDWTDNFNGVFNLLYDEANSERRKRHGSQLCLATIYDTETKETYRYKIVDGHLIRLEA